MIEFKLPPGDQSDLESTLFDLMIARAIENYQPGDEND